MDWFDIGASIFGVLMFLFGDKIGLKAILIRIGAFSNEVGEAFTALGAALEDGNLTKDEIVLVLDEADDIPAAFRLISEKEDNKTDPA